VEVGTRAARAGVHMLVEKPLATDAASARVLASEAESAGVLLQVGHLERFNPVMDEVHRLIGTPRFVECHRLSPFAGRGTDANVVVDVMIHDLDLLAFLVDRPIVDVQAVGVPVLSETVDIANARIRFEGGCIANVTASRVSLKRERKMRIFQEDAYVSLDLECRSALIARRRDPASSPASRTAVGSPADCPIGSPMDAIEVETREFADADPLAAQIKSFVTAVREGRPPAVGAREAIDALEMAGRIIDCIEVPGSEAS
ncbi:MAG: Gfo/Idh/MocA family oxidoreductase, partial [Myxococcales bacterium]